MKLYTITDEATNTITYAGTQNDARAKRIELEAPHKAIKLKDRPKTTVTEVEVPTHKQGLIDYLNGIVGA